MKAKHLCVFAGIGAGMLVLARVARQSGWLSRRSSSCTGCNCTRQMSDKMKSRLAKYGALPTPSNEVCDAPNEIEKGLPKEVLDLHSRALSEGNDTYTDPRTGFTVFTRQSHINRGRCCGSGCRHCPYGHVNVPESRKIKSKAGAGVVPATAPIESSMTPQRTSPSETKPFQSAVYTRGGDKGTTALFTGERRKKTDAVFEGLGAVDELSSHIGLARAFLDQMEHSKKGGSNRDFSALCEELEEIQQELMNVCTVIATPDVNVENADRAVEPILQQYEFSSRTKSIERSIDEMDAKLTPLRVFILPGGGNVASAQLHVCRTTCRRAERCMVHIRDEYGDQYTDRLQHAAMFVNRLSDFFFVSARFVAEEDIVRA